MKSDITKDEVLLAVAAVPFTVGGNAIYVADHVRRERSKRNAASSVRAAVIARRLKALEEDGLVERSQFPTGFYGYKWTLTDEGRAAVRKLQEKVDA